MFIVVSEIQIPLIFTVLTCEDPPVIPETKVLLPQEPYHLGSRTTYQCLPDYKLTVEDSSITCEVNNNTKMAKWSDDSLITCIPGIPGIPGAYFMHCLF